tara:strand:- start:105 stop:563 length:459 start_codon:yes stop_codon:yes gene_type:complete
MIKPTYNMKKLILLLFIPLMSVGQNNNLKSYRGSGIQGTAWEVSENKGEGWKAPRNIFIVGIQPGASRANDYNRLIILNKTIGEFSPVYEPKKQIWVQNGNTIIFRWPLVSSVYRGTVNDEGTEINGKIINTKSGKIFEFQAKRIDGDWLYD